MRIPYIALLAALLLPLPALADTYTYTYSGNDFTSVSGAYTTSDSITGEFTVSSILAPSSFLALVEPTSFNFSDGVNTITNTNGITLIFDASADTSGKIIEWAMQVETPDGARIYTEGIPSDSFDDGEAQVNFTPYTLGANENDPGTWTITDNPAPTPEPSSLLLLGTGLAGAFGLARRRARLA